MNMINENKRKNGYGRWVNPGKDYFLWLASCCIREVNQERDENCITYARNAMIITGMSLNTNGQWEMKQLNPEIQ